MSLNSIHYDYLILYENKKSEEVTKVKQIISFRELLQDYEPESLEIYAMFHIIMATEH